MIVYSSSSWLAVGGLDAVHREARWPPGAHDCSLQELLKFPPEMAIFLKPHGCMPHCDSHIPGAGVGLAGADPPSWTRYCPCHNSPPPAYREVCSLFWVSRLLSSPLSHPDPTPMSQTSARAQPCSAPARELQLQSICNGYIDITQPYFLPQV